MVRIGCKPFGLRVYKISATNVFVPKHAKAKTKFLVKAANTYDHLTPLCAIYLQQMPLLPLDMNR